MSMYTLKRSLYPYSASSKVFTWSSHPAITHPKESLLRTTYNNGNSETTKLNEPWLLVRSTEMYGAFENGDTGIQIREREY